MTQRFPLSTSIRVILHNRIPKTTSVTLSSSSSSNWIALISLMAQSGLSKISTWITSTIVKSILLWIPRKPTNLERIWNIPRSPNGLQDHSPLVSFILAPKASGHRNRRNLSLKKSKRIWSLEDNTMKRKIDVIEGIN